MSKSVPQTLAMFYAFLLTLFLVYYNRHFYHDDAYITLRYASNWIAGNGVVWNPGEFVQGYTNFLHLALIALLGWLGIDLVLASRIIGIASFVALCGTIWLFRKVVVNKVRPSLWHISAIIVVTSAPILVWSLGGLEGSLFALIVTWHCLLFLLATEPRKKPRLYFANGILGGLGFLVRPDGIIFIVVSLAWLSWTVLKNKSQGFLLFLAYLAGVALLISPYLIWQLHYYGDILPNTFYAKTGAPLWLRLDTGLLYIFDYFFSPPFLPILLGSSLAYAVLKRHWNSKLTYLVLVNSFYLIYVIWIGGDHMKSFRFLVPVIPLMSIMFAMSLNSSVESDSKIAVNFITVAILIFSSMQILDRELSPKTEDPAAYVGTIVGKYIAQAWPADSLIALNTAGSTPYYASSHRYIDMLGLNDPTIAKRNIKNVQLPWQHVPGHLKGDGSYVLSRRPDYIIVGPAEGTIVSKPWFLSDLELSRDPKFQRDYVLFSTVLDHNGNETLEKGLSFTFYKRVNSQEESKAVQQDAALDGDSAALHPRQ